MVWLNECKHHQRLPVGACQLSLRWLETALGISFAWKMDTRYTLVRSPAQRPRSSQRYHRPSCNPAEDLPPRRAIALPPVGYLAGLRTPAPELVLAEFRLQSGGGSAPAAPPPAADDVPGDPEVLAEALEDKQGPQSPVSDAGAQRHWLAIWHVRIMDGLWCLLSIRAGRVLLVGGI